MDKWTFVLVIAMAAVTRISAQTNTSSMFGELPQGNYSDPASFAATGSLATLFDMAQGFVNVVFQPFSDLTDFIMNVAQSNDALGYLLENWQEAAKFEAGFIACLVFGILFIIFVPFIGSIMCCCRCCCNNCGGRLEQSKKRSKSCWRQCLCVTMLLLTALMAIPTVFVFLTNEWITDVIDNGPKEIVAALDDTVEFTKLIPRQINYVADEYDTVDQNVRPLVENFDQSIGVPLQQFVNDSAADTFRKMDNAIRVVDDMVSAINTVDSSLTELEGGMGAVNMSLIALQSNMSDELNDPDCLSDSSCNEVYLSRTNLSIGFNVATIIGLRVELNGVNDSLNGFDLKALQSDIKKEIDEIPETTKEQTQSQSDDAVAALDEASKAVSNVASSIPKFDDIDSNVQNIQTSITKGFTTYDENFDKYRYIAGLVLGSMLAFIVGCYLLGMMLGICGNDRKVSPSERGCSSNCGGIMLMVGVGFAFIFSWLLMILVIVLFTVGGHGERYGCQGLDEPDYEALGIVEDITGLSLPTILKLPEDVDLTLAELLTSCKNKKSAYEALKLEHVYNVTSYLANVSTQLVDLENEIDGSASQIDLTTIEIYTEQNQEGLLSLKNSGIEGVDFNQYLSDLGTGVTAVDLTEYAAFLRDRASNFAGSASRFQNLVQDYAEEVDRIQSDEVEPLQDDYDSLKSSIETLTTLSQTINGTIGDLDSSLTDLNETIINDGPEEIEKITNSIFDQVSGNITAYTTWAEKQIMNEVGECYPVYQSYRVSVGIFCDYLIDTVNGLWFSLGWAVFFLIPSAIIAMKLMKFFRKMSYDESYEDSWDNVEMGDFGNKPNGGGHY